MSSIAVRSKPWWRWWRYRRIRNLFRRPGAIAKPWNGIIAVAALATFDQLTKHLLVTPDWAWHTQSPSWLIYPIIGVLLGSVLAAIPRLRLAGLLLTAGAVGNGSSELIYDRIANPFLTQSGSIHVAFNFADVCLMAALAAFTHATATSIVRNYPRRQPA